MILSRVLSDTIAFNFNIKFSLVCEAIHQNLHMSEYLLLSKYLEFQILFNLILR